MKRVYLLKMVVVMVLATCLFAGYGVCQIIILETSSESEKAEQLVMPLPGNTYKIAEQLQLDMSGAYIMSGIDESKAEKATHWLALSWDDGESWIMLPKETTVIGRYNSRWRPLLISPVNHEDILHYEGQNQLSLSEDGGRSWRGVQGCFKKPFWSIQNSKTYYSIEPDGNCVLHTIEGEASIVSKMPEGTIFGAVFLLDYALSKNRHYVKLGVPDKFICCFSDDDAKTWHKISISESPWELEGEAGKLLDELLPNRNPQARVKVEWVKKFWQEDVMFCRYEPQTEKLNSDNSGTFYTVDGGETIHPLRHDEALLPLADSVLTIITPTGNKAIVDPGAIKWNNQQKTALVLHEGKCYIRKSFEEPWRETWPAPLKP